MELLTKAALTAEKSKREIMNLQVAYEAACESIVLLKNKNVLPLESKKIAAFGPGVAHTIKGGTGSGEVNERHSVSILEGLLEAGFEVCTEKWLQRYDTYYEKLETDFKKKRLLRTNFLKKDSIMEMVWGVFQPPTMPITQDDLKQSDTDTCIYVISRQAGEGRDRRLKKGDFYLTDEEYDAIRLCAQYYKKFVLIINSGSAIDMSRIDEIDGIDAVLYMAQLGTKGGNAVADVLCGTVTPSGKLTDTWAKNYGDLPFAKEYSYLNGNVKNEFYREGIYVGYRYFDTYQVQPRYPFGFGLSYTDFQMETLSVQLMDTTVMVQVRVKNVGTVHAGKEVCQVYLSSPKGQLQKEYQALATFGKTKLLQPNEEEVLMLSFDIKDMASYKEADASYVLEAGNYLVRVGNSSRNTVVAAVICVKEDCIVSKHKNICPYEEIYGELQGQNSVEVIPENVLVLELDLNSIHTTTYSYTDGEAAKNQRALEFVDSLSLKEQIEIIVGIGMFGGKTAFTLPGAVGNTTSAFWQKGLANVTLCDGPAGLRIQKHTTIEKNGKTKPVEPVISMYEAFPKFIQKMMLGNPNKREVLYQYTTAFPVTAALAQSWNVLLLEAVGEGIFNEMKEYGCTYWLAPAVNIHRNPLCGRNFEYYSEDPRLTGTLAAALTRGVQKEKGYYVTVKHFTCNNQEDNRNFVSSNLSERTLREIYLKPFEIVVKQAEAKGIMTSYNKVNGVYTPNSYDLCTNVLRREWGFEGVVMTDWFSTGGKKAKNALAMKAGNDLIMPGTRSAKREILRGAKTGKISVDDIRRCCYNVVEAIFNSAIQEEYLR